MSDVNDGLRETFESFVLNATPDGISVVPHLRELTGFFIREPRRATLVPLSLLNASSLDIQHELDTRRTSSRL